MLFQNKMKLSHDAIEETIGRAVDSISIKQERGRNKKKPANLKVWLTKHTPFNKIKTNVHMTDTAHVLEDILFMGG